MAYSARVLRDDEYHHLNKTSIVCNNLRGKPGKYLEKYTPFSIKKEEHLLQQRHSQASFLAGYKSTISSMQKAH